MIKAYIELTKTNILKMVLVTTVLGFAMANDGLKPYDLLLWTLLGTALSSAGAGALNHYLERVVDGKMDRTRNRPLPSGRVSPMGALIFGIALSVAGVSLLCVQVNYLAALLAGGTIITYAFIYTPMKRVHWLNTPFGAIPGAIPPLIGWAGATGGLDKGAYVLFLILFLWQHPHFYAIAWMYRDDYRKGKFQMLPIVEPDGRATFRQSLACCLVLIPVSAWPTFLMLSGWLYGIGAMVLGFWFLWVCLQWRISETVEDARRVLRASVIYFPLLLLLLLIDAFFFDRVLSQGVGL